MKEVFMKMREDQWEGNPEEYLELYIKQHKLDDVKISLCPSCLDTMISHRPNDSVSCPSCHQEYKITNNNIKFK